MPLDIDSSVLCGPLYSQATRIIADIDRGPHSQTPVQNGRKDIQAVNESVLGLFSGKLCV